MVTQADGDDNDDVSASMIVVVRRFVRNWYDGRYMYVFDVYVCMQVYL